MNADIKGALENIGWLHRVFEHSGKTLTMYEAITVLNYGIKKGYETIYQITDEDFENAFKDGK